MSDEPRQNATQEKAIVTTENTEVTELKATTQQMRFLRVLGASVVKYVTRSISVNDRHHGVAGVDFDFK